MQHLGELTQGNLQVEKLIGENVQKHGTLFAKTKPIAKDTCNVLVRNMAFNVLQLDRKKKNCVKGLIVDGLFVVLSIENF